MYNSRAINIFFVTLFAICLPVYCKVLPKYIEICYRDDPNLNQCLTKEANRVLKQFCKGIPELGIVSTDPFALGSVDIIPGKSTTLYLKQTNAILKGLRNSKVIDLKIDPFKKTGYIHLNVNITMKSNYVIGGRLLLFSLDGNGDFFIKINDFDARINWNWDTFIGKDQKEYSRFNNFTSNYDHGDIKFKMNGLFNNDKVLGESMNNLLNENSREVMKELGGPIVNLVIKRIVKVINTLFSNVPNDELWNVTTPF
ncbi:circadian clock-controlled protein daywake-like isoform X2 [Arctopsyche grandis]|uniref:circadian clock-controlled protein daywake-like isoform X2 n=1 Tax=Arctopsyche grandis TaxID=121162 RepID=UPI00406D967E